MKSIALITDTDEPHLTYGEKLLPPELEKRGYTVSEIPWDNPDADWRSFDTVVLRSCWNYYRHFDTFRQWLQKLKTQNVKVFNPADMVLWNIDKKYLLELENKGVPIIPTRILEKGKPFDLEEILSGLPADEIIIKPTVGASAHHVKKYPRDSIVSMYRYIENIHASHDAMIQTFLPQISADGEFSFIFFNNAYSHAVKKMPKKDDFRTQPRYGGKDISVKPSDDLIQQAEDIIKKIDTPLLYARVDAVDDNGILRLMELELTEPYLFFELDKEATRRFADALEILTS